MKHMWCKLQKRTKMSSRQMDNIKTLSKRLGSLQIINEVLEEMNK